VVLTHPVKKPLPTDLPLEMQRTLLFEPQQNPTGYVPLEHASVFAFEPSAATHSRVNSWWLADTAWLPYWHDADAVARVFRDRAGMACQFAAIDGAEAYLSDHTPLFYALHCWNVLVESRGSEAP
jgi:hypothetical protein